MKTALMLPLAWLFPALAWAGTLTVNPAHPAAADDNPGTDARPLKTLARAAERAGPGDTVLIHTGTYRESLTLSRSGAADRPIRFEAAPGARAVLSGADLLTDWRREPGDGAVFSTPWPHRFITWNQGGTHPNDAFHAMIGRCEQVFIDGYPLLHVLARGQLARGTFFADLDARRLHVCPRDGADLAGKNPPRVEASSRQLLVHVKGAHVHLRGLTFRHAANMAQHGAVKLEGEHGLLDDCTFEEHNSAGVSFNAPHLTARRCTFRHNGMEGFNAHKAHDLLLTECSIEGNNTKGFNRDWAGGGDKLVLCRKAVIERCRVLGNRGTGLWFDIGNEDCVVRHCLIAGNEDAGLFYEISFGLHAHDNVLLGNGFRPAPGNWGLRAGVSLSSSPGCVVERNLIVGNREGFNFREQQRTTPRIDDPAERPVSNHDEVVRRNLLAYNQDAQVWGWFDRPDGRHWPPGLAKLNLAFEGNLFAGHPGQGLFHWGVPWQRIKKCATLDEVRNGLGLDPGTHAASVPFADPAARDFRLPPDSPALKLGCYPRGEVPGVRLGALPSP